MKRKYESLVGRRGTKKALIAVGHKIIVAAYHVIRDKEAYREPSLRVSPRKQKKQVHYHLRKLQELGIAINRTQEVGCLLNPQSSVVGYEIDTIRK
jgi:hypothetical protein